MESETAFRSSAAPPAPPAFNGWAVYGCGWLLATVRLLHRQLCERDTEIERLRQDNHELRNRLLLRASVTPIGEVNGAPPPPADFSTQAPRKFKSPIATRNAEARAVEEYRVRESRRTDTEAKRADIRAEIHGTTRD